MDLSTPIRNYGKLDRKTPTDNRVYRFFIAICLFVYIPMNRLVLIQHAGVLRVLTRVGHPSPVSQSPKGYSGLEYDLVEL